MSIFLLRPFVPTFLREGWGGRGGGRGMFNAGIIEWSNEKAVEILLISLYLPETLVV